MFMSATFTAVGAIVTVGHFAFQDPNPKTLAVVGLFGRFAFFDNFNCEIFKPAVLHCLTERRICLADFHRADFSTKFNHGQAGGTTGILVYAWAFVMVTGV